MVEKFKIININLDGNVVYWFGVVIMFDFFYENFWLVEYVFYILVNLFCVKGD